MPSRIVIEPARLCGDTLELAASFLPDDKTANAQRLWWRVPAERQSSITTTADPFAIAFAFPMMIAGKDTLIEGSVSPSLLQNLETFISIWSTWYPERYHRIQITATEEREPTPPATPGQAIMPFSCGVDSSFTAYRHARKLIGRRSRDLRVAVVIHGFGLTLHRPHSATIYQGILSNARAMLQSLGVDCIPISTNFQDLPANWFHSHGTQLVAALSLFSPQFDTGLVANSLYCQNLERIHGSNPYTDVMLSGKHFRIVDDGAEVLRDEKLKLIAQWPEGMKYLRVCLEPRGNHLNCCRCEKCIQAMISLRVAGLPHPPAFANKPTDRDIARTRITRGLFPTSWKYLLRTIREQNLHKTSWAKAVGKAHRRSRIHDRWNDLRRPFIPLRNAIRKLFRGTTLSRAQLAQAAVTSDRSPRSPRASDSPFSLGCQYATTYSD